VAAVKVGVEIEELTREQGKEKLNELALKYLNMSGDDFIQAWDAGKFDPERLDVLRVSAALRFAR
jgi:hypothetical protein